MKNIGMKNICEKLQAQNYDLGSMNALDFFARKGDWQTSQYAPFMNHVTAWEIEGSFEKELVLNLPEMSTVEIGDAHKLAMKCKNTFDFIVIDNPQMCFGLNNEYCEHFDAIHLVTDLLNDDALLSFNVKVEPFDYDTKVEWQRRRNGFYNVNDASCLSKDFVIDFYERFFKSRGYETLSVFWEKRPQEEGLYLMMVHLKRVNNENESNREHH